MAQVEDFYLPDELYYEPENHIWLKVEGGERARLGLDQVGRRAAGTIAYIKLMPAGRRARKGRAIGSLEAGKYVGPIKSPVEGTILEVNSSLIADPDLLNTDPYGEGWFVVVEADDLAVALADLVHGEGLQSWLEGELRDYRDKGWIKE